MENKEFYQKTFSRLTASEDVIQEVLDMDQKKAYRFTKKTVGIAAAAALTIAATGAAYAATDGNIAQLLERITVYINGAEAELADYDVTPGGDGSYTFHVGEDEKNDISVTVKPESGEVGSAVDYSISLDTGQVLEAADAVPFTLEPEDGRLYLVEENGGRLDITDAAASGEGYPYTWTDADGNTQRAVVLGTPEEYAIALRSTAADFSAAVEQ